MQENQSIEFYQRLPKVELHRHLEGSLRLNTLLEVARSDSQSLPGTGTLPSLVQITDGESYTFQNFLSKFQTLRLFYRSPEFIARVTQEAVTDAAADNVRYIELRFTPVALSKAEGFSLADVIDWVLQGVQQARQQLDIQVGLIASVNRHESPQLAEEVIGLALERQHEGIVGIDVCGNEADFPALHEFAPFFQQAKKAGMHITVHAGEWGGAANVREAIELLEAERIGHGIRVMEDPRVVDLARERGTVFEVCVTSNYQSGVIADLSHHPLPQMLASGLNVTLNTDDPSISRITLGHEFHQAHQGLGLPRDVLFHLILQAARASFLPPAERDQLTRTLEKSLRAIPAPQD